MKYRLSRGEHDPPLEFDGVVLAELQFPDLRIALYRTDGGKYVTEFRNERTSTERASEFATFQEACDWYHPDNCHSTQL